MLEFLQFAFSPAVFLFSVLLVVVMVYWAIVAFGLLSADSLDGDAGFDHDVGDVGHVGGGDAGFDHDVGDLGHDAGHEASVHGATGLNVMLSFFYVGRVPLTVLITVLVFVSWMAAVALNNRLNPGGFGVPGAWLGLVSFGIGLIAVKILGWPFAKLTASLNSSRGQIRDVTGKVCTMLTTVGPGTVGQAEIRTAAAPVIVTVVTDTDKPLARGQEAVIVRKCGRRNAYLVSPVAREGK